ncbi:hypothetical protein NDA11_000328 [Ustilago hordei]|uniref:Uncharacterized protein n=1 Tax=Ustilago hordei TaxID=120017 RepID=I2G3L5_USTHO|nr:uncharacterized protein UHO2_00840 [Ustilago hordei]KAJ1037641.1 hypothetical protein NDA10_002233 [Ustilago hordei]KAJ1583613.1 hypothetical protein NDA15_005216 [Ustilago hordei]KAJ1584451.1 hypothetical protein NDA11_000328 [Ustilago hordei]KAJ1592215.1 hypothetical protein NDA12_006599 [Ustilago hordei]KAJ1602756.1 hypothetical protein NDA14_000754 [Ustilago hordei]
MDTMMSMAAPPVLQGSSGYYTWQRQLRIYVNGVNPMMWEEITGTAYFHENQLKLHWNDKHAGEPNHQQAEDHACIVNLVATNQDMFRERNAKTKEENAKAHHNTPSSQGVNSKSHEQSKVRKELERGPDEEVYHITSTESYDQDTTDSGGICSNLPLVPFWARSVIEPLLLQISMNSAVTLILPIPVIPVLLFI